MEHESKTVPDTFLIRTSSNNYKNKLQEAIYAELRPLHNQLIHSSPQVVLEAVEGKLEKLNAYYDRCVPHVAQFMSYGWDDPAIYIKIPMTDSSFMTLSLYRVKSAGTELWKGGAER